MIERICAMLEACESCHPFFPPTELYNETWLLRLVLDWFSRHRVDPSLASHSLAFAEDASWFSEAWLPTTFAPRWRGDPLGEGWTHADGVIGHFDLRVKGKQDVSLVDSATQLVVVEAKLFSRLSKGVTHKKDYDQAARTVACMAEVLAQQPAVSLGALDKIAFYVLAPQSQIAKGLFADLLEHCSVEAKVRDRVDDYGVTKKGWYATHFQPLLQRIEIAALSWKVVIEDIKRSDPEAGTEIDAFYGKCIDYNSK